MRFSKRTHFSVGPMLTGILLATLFLGASSQTASATAAPVNKWKDTGITLIGSEVGSNLCFDGLRPNILLLSKPFNNDLTPTTSIDLTSGQRNQVSSLTLGRCNEENGNLYSYHDSFTTTPLMVFSSDDPTGKTVAHLPTYFASDGSRWVYSIEPTGDLNNQVNHLYVSPDGGLSWQERDLSGLLGQFEDIQVNSGDARLLYGLSQDTTGNNRRYGLYASNDAGVTWEKRNEFYYQNYRNPFPQSMRLEDVSTQVPTNYVAYKLITGEGRHSSDTDMISTDGGRTFTDAGSTNDEGLTFNQVLYSNNGFIRLNQTTHEGSTVFTRATELSRSTDGGKTWQSVLFPFTIPPYDTIPGNPIIYMMQSENAPSNLFMAYGDDTTGDIWHSPDGGQTWEDLAPNMPYQNLKISPYAPSFLLAIKDNKIYRLDLSSIDKTETNGVASNAAPNTTYFDQTKHNLSPLFKQYYNEHGGLDQFGMAWTEPFREVNTETDRVYTVQYFERNRFEYHPENAGTQFEVLLGLVGNNLTTNRRTEAPFKPVSDPKQTGVDYYPQTGHTLAHSFKDYWEANGGLAVYGYPISEEFEEKNPDDGKTYVVQYFERNRFEYHPENKGTRYEVLLGLLGNTLLKNKGWL